jgi:hypothetical protein
VHRRGHHRRERDAPRRQHRRGDRAGSPQQRRHRREEREQRDLDPQRRHLLHGREAQHRRRAHPPGRQRRGVFGRGAGHAGGVEGEVAEQKPLRRKAIDRVARAAPRWLRRGPRPGPAARAATTRGPRRRWRGPAGASTARGAPAPRRAPRGRPGAARAAAAPAPAAKAAPRSHAPATEATTRGSSSRRMPAATPPRSPARKAPRQPRGRRGGEEPEAHHREQRRGGVGPHAGGPLPGDLVHRVEQRAGEGDGARAGVAAHEGGDEAAGGAAEGGEEQPRAGEGRAEEREGRGEKGEVGGLGVEEIAVGQATPGHELAGEEVEALVDVARGAVAHGHEREAHGGAHPELEAPRAREAPEGVDHPRDPTTRSRPARFAA